MLSQGMPAQQERNLDRVQHAPHAFAVREQSIADNLTRLETVWQAMVDEPQDPGVAARIASNGKRKDVD